MDLHDRFDDWLADGAEGEPPRDLALHASTCDGCLRAVAVVESLQAVRVGAAELPPLRVAGRPGPFRIARMAVGAIAVVLLAVSVGIGATGMLRTAPAAGEPAASTAEGVLAGRPTAEATERSASPSPTPSASDTPTPGPSQTPVASADPTAAPVPVAPVPPAPRTAAPLPPAPAPPPPTVAPPTPAPPTPAPTPAPTAAPTSAPPTPSPTPEPSPTPVLDDCEDGIDNDVDTFIDLLDPGCTLSGNEADA